LSSPIRQPLIDGSEDKVKTMKKAIKRFLEKNKIFSKIIPIALVIILGLIGYFSFAPSKNKNLNETEAKTRATEFINSYLMSPGSKATITEISKEYGLYKLKVDIVSSVVDSYLSRDGKLFFPQALNIDEVNSGKNDTAAAGADAAPAAEVSNKNDKPVVELFVMSHCPYGTQAEKGILPVVEALGNKIDFQIKFNSYAMHGETELLEEINQYCIMTEQPKAYNAYLKCFLAAGESAPCLTEAGINQSSLSSCATKTDDKYKITENFKNKVGYQGNYPGFDIFKDDNTKYNVGGSPTLVINGQQISSNRDAASLLKTICSAFNTQPEACKTVLSSDVPAPGFGTGTTAAASAGTGCE
jgi:hypothetical protein